MAATTSQDDDFILDALRHVKPMEIVMHQLRQAAGFVCFYPRDAILARVIVIATCLSVRLSVCHAPVLCQYEES